MHTHRLFVYENDRVDYIMRAPAVPVLAPILDFLTVVPVWCRGEIKCGATTWKSKPCRKCSIRCVRTVMPVRSVYMYVHVYVYAYVYVEIRMNAEARVKI